MAVHAFKPESRAMSQPAGPFSLDMLRNVNALTRACNATLAPSGINLRDVQILQVLSERECATPTDLANHLGLSRSLISQHLPGLLKREWIREARSDTDRRITVLSIQPRGTIKLREIERLLMVASHQVSVVHDVPV